MLTELRDRDVQWTMRRLPKAVRELLKSRNGIFLAGGFIRACIAGEDVNDVDLFAPSKDEATIVARQLAGAGEIVETDNAFSFICEKIPVQVIHRWTYDSPIACVESFDFTIAAAAIWWRNPNDAETPAHWASCCDQEYYADLAGKRLVYRKPVRNEDAGGSLLRVLKFYQRGYRIPLDSLGAVIARLLRGIEPQHAQTVVSNESFAADVITGLLVEVDPGFAAREVASHE